MKIPVMIIDDNKVDRYILQRFLKKCSYDVSVIEATDGRDALDIFENHQRRQALEPDLYPPMLIFLDINMPRVNGFEFLERFSALREKLGLESIVVIMFSSSPQEEDEGHSLKWPFVKKFVVKGEFSPHDLDEICKERLSGGPNESVPP